MLSLKDREWKEFKIGDVFIVTGTITTKPESLINYGRTPRVTCSAVNNGYDNFYENSPTEKGKCLTVDSATIGSVMYQNNDFIATDHVEKLIIQGKNMNRYIGLFIKTVIDNCCSNKYSYGYKFSQNRIKQQHILLPVTSAGEPDWQFMEDYTKEREKSLKTLEVENIRKQLQEMEKDIQSQTPLNLQEREWKKYRIGDIFEIERGNATNINKRIESGQDVLVSATDNNNGFYKTTTFCQNDKIFQDTLSVNNNGNGVCLSFYHSYPFIASSDVSVLTAKDPNKLNKYVYIFVSNMIKSQKAKFNYGYKMSNQRMIKQNILLPASSSGEPDWEYMENYIKGKMVNEFKQYLKYLEQ